MIFRGFVRHIRRAIARTPRVPPPPVAVGEFVLREATTQDLRALAQLHVRAFNETHLAPGESGPTYSTREWQWRDKLAETDATHFVLVLETESKELVGFIWCHPTRDSPIWAARLNKIYLLRGYQRRGLGKRMVAAAVARLLEHGLTSMALFTEIDNAPACSFYDQLGGERQLNDRGEFEGMFGWRDLRQLHSDLARLNSN
jgi:ribosomal protein S18 acetylase RimI-like enzyme